MLKVELWEIEKGLYFSLSEKGDSFDTSFYIARLFDMDVKQYNKMLIEKVIQHDIHCINAAVSWEGDDLVFKRNFVTDTEYIERFKNVFNKELTTLALGGI